MIYVFLGTIFVLTFFGGSIPLVWRKMSPHAIHRLLAFTGAFLFGITMLHLVPEAFRELGTQAGWSIIAGFCLQLFLEAFSHGAAHGHAPDQAAPADHAALSTLLLGLSLHAFMEGLPLGDPDVGKRMLLSLALAISFHKIPEAFTLMTIVRMKKERLSRGWLYVCGFAAVTPFAAVLALYLGDHFTVVSRLLAYMVALVTGAFLHISTTILFESGIRAHHMDKSKIVAILLGLGLVAATLTFG